MDVFETLPDGTLIWRATINGPEKAITTLPGLAGKNSNEFQVMDLGSKALIATVNGPKAQTRST